MKGNVESVTTLIKMFSSGEHYFFTTILSSPTKPADCHLQHFLVNSFVLLIDIFSSLEEVVFIVEKNAKKGRGIIKNMSSPTIESERGIGIALNVQTRTDLNRRVVRSDYTCVQIPEVELEIPAQNQKGAITTVEVEHSDAAAAMEEFIELANALKELKTSFTLNLENINGNSFIENPDAPAADRNCKTVQFMRSDEENNLLGVYDKTDIAEDDIEQICKLEGNHLLKSLDEGAWTYEDLHGEVIQFRTLCPEWRSACKTNVKFTNLLHFKEVVIMATVCDVCCCKTNEVKSGGGIEEKGVRFEVTIAAKENLTRDVLKSETCSLRIPELDCKVGRFTTIEGILLAMKDQLENDDLMFHDSLDEITKERLQKFLKKFNDVISLESEVSLILDDPAGNSFVQSSLDIDEPGDKWKIVKYESSYDQNEELD
ncbi:hypothetical protein GQX74_007472 [Glossina fuscipes]|nr:hypothetical protein GQX74_007472 [Glossina fuscipes]